MNRAHDANVLNTVMGLNVIIFCEDKLLMIIPKELEGVLDANPKVISGAVRFVGTRVPVQALIDTLDGGDIEEFLDGWPDVSREQAEAVIHWQQNQARSTFGLQLAS